MSRVRRKMTDVEVMCHQRHSTSAAGLPVFQQEPQSWYPMRKPRHWLRIIAPLLGVMLVLAGCQKQNFSNDGERRDGFYGGITGGWARP
jgi:hypothetical protein